MNQPAIFDNDIRALQEWLRNAWAQLGDPSLTAFTRRELRNQMKQSSADLRRHLQLVSTRPAEPAKDQVPKFSKPELRIWPDLGDQVPKFSKPELRILA